jgi:hypothetical protein
MKSVVGLTCIRRIEFHSSGQTNSQQPRAWTTFNQCSVCKLPLIKAAAGGEAEDETDRVRVVCFGGVQPSQLTY